MAGFEVIVRPVVFPNIRPAPPRVLPPEEDPEQGICVIGGSGGGLIDLPHSWSVSLSRQRSAFQEAKRQVNKEQINQVDKNGNINKNNHVIVERLKRVRMDTPDGPITMLYNDPPPPPPGQPNNIDILEKDVTR